MKKQAFSLLEVMIAVTVLFIGITVVMSSLSSSYMINMDSEEQGMAISALVGQSERLKSITDLAVLENEFGGVIPTSFPQAPSYFHVPGLRAATTVVTPPAPMYPPYNGSWANVIPGGKFIPGQSPALGIIIPTVPLLPPDPPPHAPSDPAELMEYTIQVSYESEISGDVTEEVTIQVSHTK